MALFHYEAFSQDGKKITGFIDADSLEVAKERLRKQGALVTALLLRENEKKEVVLTPSQLLAFTRDLGQLLRAGLPVYESLITIEEKYRNQKIHPLFLELCDHLKNGSSLSSALKKFPKSFDSVYLSMVQAAEQTSSLGLIFDRLSLLIAKQQKLKKQLISALTYPALLSGFCLFVLLSLFLFIVPTFQELFEGRTLHPLTQIVIALSNFLNQHWQSLLASTFVCIIAIYLSLRHEKGKRLLQRLFLKTPFFKSVIIQAALIRFCRSLSLLLNGGVPLIDALALSRRVMKQLLLEKIIEDAEKKVVEGEKLSEELKNSPLIPSLVTRMLAIAEQTGKMAPMLASIADIYDEELEKNLTQMTTLLQPVLLLFLGGMVGFVLLSVLLPLTDIGSFN
jgi:general secretion pathway protein F